MSNKEEEFELEFNNTEDDEIVVLRLPRREAKTLRDMIKRQQAMSWLWKWLTAFFFAFLSGILLLINFGETLKKGLISWLGA